MPLLLVHVLGPDQAANDAFCALLASALPALNVFCHRNRLVSAEVIPAYPDVVVLACHNYNYRDLAHQVLDQRRMGVTVVLCGELVEWNVRFNDYVVRQAGPSRLVETVMEVVAKLD